MRNLPTKMQLPGGKVATYRYNASGQRVYKRVENPQQQVEDIEYYAKEVVAPIDFFEILAKSLWKTRAITKRKR